MLAAAVLDRLLHTGIVVSIDGLSYRMRAYQQRSDALRPASESRPLLSATVSPAAPDHRHHPQTQPPLLLAALPRRRLARPPPPHPQRRC